MWHSQSLEVWYQCSESTISTKIHILIFKLQCTLFTLIFPGTNFSDFCNWKKVCKIYLPRKSATNIENMKPFYTKNGYSKRYPHKVHLFWTNDQMHWQTKCINVIVILSMNILKGGSCDTCACTMAFQCHKVPRDWHNVFVIMGLLYQDSFPYISLLCGWRI